jgi:hypothetical protein
VLRVDGVRAQRGLLKAALRRFGLRAARLRRTLPHPRQRDPIPGAGRIEHTRRAAKENTMDMRQDAGSNFIKFNTAPTEQQLAERAARKPPAEINDEIPF